MVRTSVIFSLIVMSTLSSRSQAEEDPAACADLTSTPAILRCAVERHPAARAARLAEGQSQLGAAVARQWVNPEVNNQTTYGPQAGNHFYAELNFAHTFELGGKRSARVAAARAGERLTHVEGDDVRVTVHLTTLTALYRLRQIEDEVASYDDALQTFARIKKQYATRPRLSPEQKASLSIFEIAEQDYRLKRTGIRIERDGHERTLELAVGRPLHPDRSALPPRRTAWPKLPGEDAEGVERAAVAVKLAHAELDRSRASLEVESAAAWPDLKFGPTVTFQRQYGHAYVSYGLNFALPLPLYHRNAAGEAFAAKGIERAAAALRTTEHETRDQLYHVRKRYEDSVESLGRSLSPAELGRKHAAVERMFDQGFVTGSTIVEIHRQIADLIRTQNEHELAVVDAFVRFNALSGRPEVFE